MKIIEDISVVFLYVGDLEKSVAFYRDLMGVRFDALEGDWIEGRFPSGVRFALHQSYAGREPQTPGTAVISFMVHDLTSAVVHLREAGVVTDEPTREDFGSFVEIADPDGYRIQLFEAAGH